MSISALSIGVSGMQAAEARLNAASSNIANVRTAGSLDPNAGPAPYQPIDAVSVDIGSGPSGVMTSYQPRNSKPVAVSDPDSGYADANGMVGMPDIDIASEMVSALMARYEFAASAKMVGIASDMQKTATDILA